MVRSRDFLLFALVLVFLCAGIGITVTHDLVTERKQMAGIMEVDFTNQGEGEYTATAVGSQIDRSSNIAKLREKIAAGLGLSQGEPVLTSVVEAPVNQDEPVTDRQPQHCAGYDNSPTILSTWPNFGVTTTFVEGVRLVQVAEVVGDTGSSTRPALTEGTLIQLPATQLRRVNDTCIDSVVVGIDTNGRLIRNGDTTRYAGYTEFMLVGYARDGFPIYGFKGSTAGLDACGGKQEVTGYRYYLRDTEDFVLGCFAGKPALFR